MAQNAVTIQQARPAGVAAAGDDNYKWKAFWVTAISLFTMVMDFSVTSIALPSIARDFDLTLRAVSWVVISAALTITAVLMPFGRLADIAGRKTVYLTGVALFSAGAVVAALSQNLPMLISARIVMALGAAMNQAVGMAIVAAVFPQQERGKGLGMITTVVGIGAVAGPILGGPLVQFLGWRSIYYFLFIPSLPAFLLGWFVLKDARIGTVKRAAGQPYDWFGALSSAAFLSLFVFTMTNPLDVPWSSLPIVSGAALVAALFALFVWWELKSRAPMINLGFFRSAQFSWSTTTRFVGFIGTTAIWFLMPFYIQDVLGKSPGEAGLVIFFGAFGMAVTGFMSGRLSDRFGSRLFISIGLSLGAFMGLVFTLFNASTPVWLIVPALLVNGVAQGLWMAPNMSVTLGAVDRANYGIVSAFLNLVRNIANVTGTAVATAVVAGVMIARGVGADLGGIGEAGPEAADAFVSGMRIMFVIQFVALGLAFAAAMATREAKLGARQQA